MPADHAAISDLLAVTRTIAVVGATDTPGRPVDEVGRYLIRAGFRVIPVHPVRRNVWGLDTYATVRDIPDPVDVVNLFRAPRYCPEHARETLAMRHRPRAFWMQSGITSPEASAILKNSGILVVEDRCILVEHSRRAGAP